MKFRSRTINAGDAAHMVNDNPDFLFEFYQLVDFESVGFGWHGATNDEPTSPPISSACIMDKSGFAHFDFKDTPVYMELPYSALIKIGWHAEVPDDFAPVPEPLYQPSKHYRV